LILESYLNQARLLLQVLSYLEYEKPDGIPLFALKGGTALNFFVQPLPRLSVDADLTYCPLDERNAALATMRASIQLLADTLAANIPGVQCFITHHAGMDKLLVRHEGITVKVEPNSLLRGTVYPLERRELCPEAQSEFRTIISIPCLAEAELYGGKICAALDRQHPRDLFDILPLMRQDGLTYKVRKAFIVYALSHPRPLAELLKPNLQPLKEIFHTEFSGMTRQTVTLTELEEARVWLLEAVLRGLTEAERRFLLSAKDGNPDWSLPDLPDHVKELPGIRWKLLNIDKLRQSPQKHKAALAKLKNCLGL
jgi:hypothetical protein